MDPAVSFRYDYGMDFDDLPLFSGLLKKDQEESVSAEKKSSSPKSKTESKTESKSASASAPSKNAPVVPPIPSSASLPQAPGAKSASPTNPGSPASAIADALARGESAAAAAAAAPQPEPPRHLTVTELTAKIKGVVEPNFNQVWVQGEVSNYRPSNSGHLYFSLKDKDSCISAAVFGWGSRGRARSFEIKDGLQLLCRGKISLYAPRGTYQLVIDQMEPLGAGALQVAFEQLKAKLQAEGLFDQARKRKLPPFPSRIAVVTSPSGAAIQDMLNILRRRAPHMRVTIIPAIVQGDSAPEQIIRGLELANKHELGEIVVLARGGGSIEDLWCFNNEDLARAIAKSRLPVVSAVGHEIDFTISDFVSDLRAPTPSAAAEIVSSRWVEVAGWIQEAKLRLKNAMLRDLAQRKNLLTHVAARVVSPRDRLREQAQRCDDLALRLDRAWMARMDRRHAQLEQLAGKLDALSPLKVLERGYSIVREENEGKVVRSVSQLHSGQEYEIMFHDGRGKVRAT